MRCFKLQSLFLIILISFILLPKIKNMNNLSNPLISIITVVFNGERYIEETILSVLNQTYKNIEYIIIDGGSNDGTLEIIKKYQNNITFWVSEADNGIADAMNKGLKYAKGEFVLFIHADDYLIDSNCIRNAVDKFDDETSIFIFGVLFETAHHKTPYYSTWNFGMYLRMRICHQGVLCKKQLFEKKGYFDTTLKISMDYDFFLKCYLDKNVKAKTFHDVLAVMRDTGISSKTDWRSLKRRFDEEKKVHFTNCQNSFGKLCYHLYWLFYLPYRFLLTGMKENK
jgi:glycosyltransferase involved in cell wall biosynthesis